MSEAESKLKNEIQRIYVGGISPPMLTVEMVQSRLIKTLSETIDIVSFDSSKSKTNLWGEDTQRFFFMTAKLKDTENGNQHKSALDAVAKLFNNVKWKGCTLKVEKARLHILDRLKLEREQLEYDRVTTSINTNESSIQAMNHQNDEHTELIQTKKLKRHLRIRRRFGEEAYVVDTKPIEAKNQKELHLSLKKQREKLSKHIDLLLLSKKKKKDEWAKESLKQESNVSLQSKVFLNRAVHIHFDEDNIGHSSVAHNILNEEFEHHPTVSDHDSDSTGSVSSSSDSDDIDERNEENERGYAWSDEDSSEDSKSKMDRKRNDLHPRILNDDESISSEESNQSKDIHESDDGYVWSDSEDESSDDGKNNNGMKEYDYNTTKHDDLDEFAAFFNEDIEDSSPFDSTSFNEENLLNQEATVDLGKDVKSNLNIMSQLFPDMATKVPISFTNEGEKKQPQNLVGLDSFGIIQRYDPFADSTTNHEHDSEQINSILIKDPPIKFENDLQEFQGDVGSDDTSSSSDSGGSNSNDVNKNDDENDENQSNQMDSTDNSTDNSTVDSRDRLGSDLQRRNDASQKDPMTKPANMAQIYEQKKLENIFQQDKTSGGTTTFSMSSLFQTELENKNTSAITQPSNGGFSFSFQPNKDDNRHITDSDSAAPNIVKESAELDSEVSASLVESSVDPDQSLEPVIKLKKRRGISFSKQELDQYFNDFFNLNEGIDTVAEHLQNTKSPSYLKSQDKWQEQRKSLTSDWKRKHKFAVAQRKKKFRYR